MSHHPLARQIRILVATGVAALALAAVAGFQLSRSAAPAFHGTPYPETPPAPAFTLVDHTGQPASLEDFRGSPVLLFFGYTACPDFCPLTLTRLSAILDAHPDELDDVRVLLVTVDPETDTPAALAEYVRRFGPAVTGLTGAPDTLARINRDYGVYAEPGTGHDGHPTLAHSTLVFGIDRSGRLQVLIHPEEGEERVADDIRALAAIGA